MKIIRCLLLLSLSLPIASSALFAQQPWQTLQMLSRNQALQIFAHPSAEYGPDLYYELDHATPDSIPRDLDRVVDLGFRAVAVQAGRQMSAPYLSAGYFDLFKVLLREAARRDLRVWIVDDAGYPSGFAGGKFSSSAPSLRMQALAVTNSIDLTPGLEFEDVVSADFVSAVAYNLDTMAFLPIAAVDRHIRFTPPAGRWRLLIADHLFRTSPTRSTTNPSGAKDKSQSLENYLDLAATRQFLDFTHEQYSRAIGDEFGKTVLGFRGDEPDFSIYGLPWTSGIFAEFQRRKGYDLQPSAAALFLPRRTPELERMAADYADLWSSLFRENFFHLQANWCQSHHLEYQVHLNHEDDLPRLASSEGDFLRDLTAVQIPGVDAIWHQIWPGITPDFPKLAASAAHLAGHPRAFTESFAAYRPEPNLAQVAFILNEQIARGINLVEVMNFPRPPYAAAFFSDPGFPALMRSVGRTTALLSLGRPTASVALYIPTRNFWMHSDSANSSLLSLTHQLLDALVDFDFIDDDSLRSAVTVSHGALRTASGNQLRTVLVPRGSLLSLEALHTLQALRQSGGQVVFFGSAPQEAASPSVLHPSTAPALAGALVESEETLTAAVRATLPPSDLLADAHLSGLRFVHRSLANAEIYFLFNESSTAMHQQISLAGPARVEQWSPSTGQASPIASKSLAPDRQSITLDLPPQATLLLCLHR